MSHKPLPLPPRVWQQLVGFFEAGATGDITLHVREGVVLSYEIKENAARLTSQAERPVPAPPG